MFLCCFSFFAILFVLSLSPLFLNHLSQYVYVKKDVK